MKSLILPILTSGLLLIGNLLQAQTCSNLVTNPNGTGGSTGWTYNSGSTITTITDGSDDCFVYSTAGDNQTQTIDLTGSYSASELGEQPNITFSQRVKSNAGSSCTGSDYSVTVTLEDASNNVLATWTTGNKTTTSTSSWDDVVHSFVAYGGTPRYVTIMNTGSDCNSSASDYGTEYTAISLVAITPAATAGTATATQYPNSTIAYDDASTCLETGVVLASGASGLGNTTVQSFEDASVNFYNGQPYLQRHFEIAPSSQNNATVTFYVDQAHFDAYNTARGSFPALPSTGNVADSNLSNLVITAFHGSPTGGFDPGNYPVNARELIPNSAITKVWNADASRWEFSFSISNFSGFFFSGGSTPLDIHMGELALATRNGHHALNWATYNEAAADYFSIERSADGKTFSAIAKIQCSGKPGAYAFTDAATPAGTSYYRLKLINGRSGTATYSNVVNGRTASAAIDMASTFPNPANGVLNVRMNAAQDGTVVLSLSDAAGQELKRMTATGATTQMDIHGIPAGIYFLNCRVEGGEAQTIKVVVQ